MKQNSGVNQLCYEFYKENDKIQVHSQDIKQISIKGQTWNKSARLRCNNPNLGLSISMHLQNLTKFHQVILKILRKIIF